MGNRYRLVLGNIVFLETDQRGVMLNMLNFLAEHAPQNLLDMVLLVDGKLTPKTIFMLSKSEVIKDMYPGQVTNLSLSKVDKDDLLGLPDTTDNE